jgi:hypothetical protein
MESLAFGDFVTGMFLVTGEFSVDASAGARLEHLQQQQRYICTL